MYQHNVQQKKPVSKEHKLCIYRPQTGRLVYSVSLQNGHTLGGSDRKGAQGGSFWGPGNVTLLNLTHRYVEEIVHENSLADTSLIQDSSVCIFLRMNLFLKGITKVGCELSLMRSS